jgi:hypothetical protein
MEPKETDFEFTRGDTCPISFDLVTEDGEQVQLNPTTDEVYFTLKKNYSTQNYVLQKKYTNGDIVQNGNTLNLVLTHTDTANLSYGKYVYDIQVKSGTYVHTVAIGQVTLTNESTWISNE